MILRCKPKQTLLKKFKTLYTIRNFINDVANPKMMNSKKLISINKENLLNFKKMLSFTDSGNDFV